MATLEKVAQMTMRDIDPLETREWLNSFESVLQEAGPERAAFLLGRLIDWGRREGVVLPFTANTPYVNTIPVEHQPAYPGDRAIERRIKSLIRWNATAMVIRAQKLAAGIGGHIATYQSVATLFEVGFNHFFRSNANADGDQIFFQGHAAPGIYSRAFLEYRLDPEDLVNFRREMSAGGGLSSYPHPWLMPDFWEFPTVSMGLSPITAIYQARFNRYLKDRGIKDTTNSKVWAFLGDGESDEPETLGAMTLASREGLDNLIFVVNCNLQRLDGPVRGNGQIIQELEAAFRGAGWNVIKVLWGEDWDPLFEADTDGLLVKRMNEIVDGQWQKYVVEPGSYTRQHFFGIDPRMLKLVEHLSDEQIQRLRRGGHDPVKVHAAFDAATKHTGQPTVILAKTIKGYGLGEAGEGMNITHQQKKLDEEQLGAFRDRFDIPISDEDLAEAPFYRPDRNSEEFEYMMERRRALGGFVPSRRVHAVPVIAPPLSFFDEFLHAGKQREAATTMSAVRMIARLMDHPQIGKYVVPIVPDEARTFGMDALFRKYGIYSHRGQLYEPVDSHLFLYYREAKNGQILEEGITEAGSMASFTAAGTAPAHHGVNTIPFFIFYSMFGFQRIADLIWAHADSRGKGFLLGATSGRTTLAGEGLQHQDGHSHLLASTVPNIQPYDPAFGYEIAVIVQDGLYRMYQNQEDVFYYITVQNEVYEQPPMPAGVQNGILQGIYKYRPATITDGVPRIHLFGSGSILREVLRAQEILADRFNVGADVWSVTSYTLLRRQALAVERWNLLHPGEDRRQPYITRQLAREPWPVVAASDYMKALPDLVSRWTPKGLYALGTDGFGRSETRENLRRFFEVDGEHIALAALSQLVETGEFDRQVAAQAVFDLGIDPSKPNPMTS